MPLSGPAPASPPVRRPPAGGGRYPHALLLLQKEYVEAGAVVTTGTGGYPVEAPDTETGFRGWIQPQGAPAAPAGLGTEDAGLAYSSHILFAPMSITPRKNDRVRFDADGGKEYEIVNEPRDAAGRGHHWEIDLVEYRYEGAA